MFTLSSLTILVTSFSFSVASSSAFRCVVSRFEHEQGQSRCVARGVARCLLGICVVVVTSVVGMSASKKREDKCVYLHEVEMWFTCLHLILFLISSDHPAPCLIRHVYLFVIARVHLHGTVNYRFQKYVIFLKNSKMRNLSLLVMT